MILGCGWGFLLIEAAKKYHVHGVGITLSQEQKKKFEERIHEEHLENLLEVHLLDYRDLPKSKENLTELSASVCWNTLDVATTKNLCPV